jgi:hypothetical protein
VSRKADVSSGSVSVEICGRSKLAQSVQLQKAPTSDAH